MSKKLKSFIISFIILTIIGYAAGVALHYFTQEPSNFVDSLTTDYAFVGAGVGAVAGIIFAFMSKPKKEEAKNSKGKPAGGQEMELSYDAQWLSVDKIASTPGLISTTWSALPSLKNTGIVFRNQIVNGKYQIGMKDEYHCLIIGTTASGKTSVCLVPSIRIYAHNGENP